MRKASGFVVLLVMALCSDLLSAHQPILAGDISRSREKPFDVKEPEISKAIFAELNGAADFFRIESDSAFNFYVGLTKPKLDGCQVERKFSLELLSEDFSLITTVDGISFDWWPWYEEFGRKWYWVGPEIGEDFKSNHMLDKGTYYIRVHNELNKGNYVLAIGDIESFPIGVMARMLRDLPKINRKFWDNATCDS